ncbi:bifunctional 4-hydroxy-2-oxoglutarate aldolase/2-dehydro-3-deoxy-phosphogluconate aldolase [Aquiflexum gelatinilyticum]|uniref:Bifunctional 4-hydroxy-2-oxoglutarate aldolase/2-dehydro-3-deoxy-phosphogluconate aldolase n=1 Tax=Aquiflexum gelatinilyticum TaxID=2961943 RepID=A0A9X2P5A8_9BACT|nr:bifunctional 4-hydroxy-2-oxoglutarate aldolase/2-dehydro-3-deoxy-phosphogluconate aldolase [Aquiflexum gelatinilyticum]MCR9015622.1 bifunctional 4-hydroxy-2-oxoglutarate aldolase/2-dehydro-3-deoxy-phosphogluconate aldolase [Aquiflexum gelatinilyticum]MCS4432964.1 bifunctional 4-hydroxy-2-oxoglutarate aldolase/2-dehydro-3-deoxy-phosphogluconate aldolase [Aquiflexum gelatinilyticum]
MKYTHQEILEKMAETGMIPVFNHKDISIAKAVIDASYIAGIRVFEFTNRETNAFEVFKELKIYSEKYPDLLLGIGTVFSAKDASRFHYIGTDFVVSPALIPEVANYCTMKGIFWVPGCATVTEVFQAKSMGALLVKAFPGNLLGSGFIKSVLSVMPDIKMMPTGGVEPTQENLSEWFKAGVHCVGMGSQLFDKKAIEKGEFEVLESNIKKALVTIQEIRK